MDAPPAPVATGGVWGAGWSVVVCTGRVCPVPVAGPGTGVAGSHARAGPLSPAHPNSRLANGVRQDSMVPVRPHTPPWAAETAGAASVTVPAPAACPVVNAWEMRVGSMTAPSSVVWSVYQVSVQEFQSELPSEYHRVFVRSWALPVVHPPRSAH